MKRRTLLLSAALAVVVSVLVAGGLFFLAIEEPAFEVVETLDGVEVRRYAPYVVAEMTVEGDFEEAGNRAFRTLAGYIGGDNRGAARIEMTAPVLQEPAGGRSIDMTAPVLQRSAADGSRHSVAFVLPARFDLDSAPAPTDPRVELREVPARTVAVRRYRGRWTESRYREQESRLLATLAAAGYEPVGAPEWARYNPPMLPWFLRRNEVLVEVRRPDAG